MNSGYSRIAVMLHYTLERSYLNYCVCIHGFGWGENRPRSLLDDTMLCIPADPPQSWSVFRAAMWICPCSHGCWDQSGGCGAEFSPPSGSAVPGPLSCSLTFLYAKQGRAGEPHFADLIQCCSLLGYASRRLMEECGQARKRSTGAKQLFP